MSAFRVRLKFHDGLMFFLKSKNGSEIIERNLSEKTSVKDVIESCGVPHPEVDLILVNSMPVDFSHPIVKDADIDLYPVQSQCLLFKEKRLQVRSIKRFVADGHLGTLVRNLRLLGFDVAYDRQAQDRQLRGRWNAKIALCCHAIAVCSCTRLSGMAIARVRKMRTTKRLR